MQNFIDEINSEIPKISKKNIFKLLMKLKWRFKKYNKIWLGKRDWQNYWISTRQMTYFIDLLINTWHLIENWKTRTKDNFICRTFKLSKYLIEELSKLKDYVLTKVENLSDRIKKWEDQNDCVNYIKNNYGFYKEKSRKKWFKVDWLIYVIHTYWNYENMIFDTTQNKVFTLFNFIKEIKRLYVLKTALFLNIIW